MSSDPYFSICIPTFNACGYVLDCLASVVSQTFEDWELIVCDDCSTDLTLDVVKRFVVSEPALAGRFTLIRMDENSGPFLARRRAFAQAQGRYVICLDSDDELNSKASLYEIHKAICQSSCDVLLFNMTDQKNEEHFLVDYSCLDANGVGPVSKEKVIAAFSSGYQLNNLASKAIRRQCLGIGDCQFSKGLRMCEDRLEMVGVLGSAEKFYLYDKALYYYRPNCISTTHGFFSFEYCKQQALVENVVSVFLDSMEKRQDLLKTLNRNSLLVISHDMRRLAAGRTIRCLAKEMERLSSLPWFEACLSRPCLEGTRVDIRLRIKLLERDYYFLAACVCKLLDALE